MSEKEDLTVEEINKLPEVIELQKLVDEVSDGGFHMGFGPDAHKATPAQLAKDAAKMLQNYKEGKFTTLEYDEDGKLIGDPFGHNEGKEDSE